MPELPEVEIIKQSLKKKIIYQRILGTTVRNRNLRYKLDKYFAKRINNKKIINVERKAKYLIIYLNSKSSILIHFGMSGTLHFISKSKRQLYTNLSFYHSNTLPKKHNHIELNFKKFKIIYNDPRRFGFFKLFKNNIDLNNYIKKNGLEPLNKNFNHNYLIKNIKKRTKNIKNILLDQKIISGIGNIYANEILFYCKINPLKPGNKLSLEEFKKIALNAKKVLKKAIVFGGSSIRDFKNSDGKTGNFQNEFRAYDKENSNCPNINCYSKIKKIIVSNRSTFYCKNCQK